MTDTLGDRIKARRDGLLGMAQTTAQSYTDQAMTALLEASQQWITPQDRKKLQEHLGDTPETIAQAIAASVTAYVDNKITEANAYTDAAIAKLIADNGLQS